MPDLQETALTRYRNGDWQVSTSDTTFKNLMERRGYKPHSTSDDYCNYLLPANAITVRSLKSVENPSKGNPANFRHGSIPASKTAAPADGSD